MLKFFDDNQKFVYIKIDTNNVSLLFKLDITFI